MRQIKKEKPAREDQMKRTGKKLTNQHGDLASTAVPDSEQSSLPPALLGDIRSLIESARVRVAVGVNAELVMLHWHIGYRIRKDIQKSGRGVYGGQIIELIACDLTNAYGRGFSEKSLRHMIRFVGAYEDEKIVSTLSRQLSWSHFLDLIYIDDPLKRGFYTELCRLERWSVRTLREKLDGMLYERTALSKKSGELFFADVFAVDLLPLFSYAWGKLNKPCSKNPFRARILPVPCIILSAGRAKSVYSLTVLPMEFI